MRLINFVGGEWREEWQQVAKTTLATILVLSAIVVAVLGLFGLFD